MKIIKKQSKISASSIFPHKVAAVLPEKRGILWTKGTKQIWELQKSAWSWNGELLSDLVASYIKGILRSNKKTQVTSSMAHSL